MKIIAAVVLACGLALSQTGAKPAVTAEERNAVLKLQVQQQAALIQQYQLKLQVDDLTKQIAGRIDVMRAKCAAGGIELKTSSAGDLECAPPAQSPAAAQVPAK